MALTTLGTAATSTLKAIKWNSAMGGVSSGVDTLTNLAALNALILTQGSRAPTTVLPLPSINQGILYIPTRMCSIKLFEGDFIAVDPVTGEVIVINAASAAGASWVHSP